MTKDKKTLAKRIRDFVYYHYLEFKKIWKYGYFTILSNNCWGGFVYQQMGFEYRTPLIGLNIPCGEFVKFCSNWEWYLKQDLVFIPWEKSLYFEKHKDDAPFPIARLGDIELYFIHYESEQEAEKKWKRRLKRINPRKVIFKLSQRKGCSREVVEQFMALPWKHKVCFAYDEVPGTIYVPELKDLEGNEWPILKERFDAAEYILKM